MDSIPSRRNQSPFRTRNSRAASKTLGNSPALKQGSTVLAGGISSSNAAFFPQRTANCNTGQGLSRSYDSPEGIRRMSHAPAKTASFSFCRAASPPSCPSSSKRHSSASGRNQTIQDDAAWMSERLLNLQRTGFLRYSSLSKLRDPVGIQPDEPLSAFKLAEVTLSEEDLLTDISWSKDFSPSMQTPVLLECNKNCDQVSSKFHEDPSLSQEIGEDYQKNTQQNDVSNSNANHPHSAAILNSTSSIVRGDLLLRLEALQYRAELAAKEGNASLSNTVNANQYNQNLKLFGSGEPLCWDQNLSFLNQKWNASCQESFMASSASPTHSTLSIESISWPQEPGNPSDSTCWLKDIKQEAVGEPSASHLNQSSSIPIRLEYYLPLSEDEGPVLEAGSSPFSSSKEAKRTESRNGNIRRSALSACQQKCQGRPEKSLDNQKQRSLVWKNKRVLQSSIGSGGMPVNSSPKPLPRVSTRRTVPRKERAPQNYLCGDDKGIANDIMREKRKSENKIIQMEAFPSEMHGQTRTSTENNFECDGDSSWISEENVEGFLCSQPLTVIESEALSASNSWPSPSVDTNLMHLTAETSSLTAERSSNDKNTEEFELKNSEKHLFPSSQTHCLVDTVIDGSSNSTGGIYMLDCCKEMHTSSESGSINISQTDACLQLLKGESPGDSCQAAKESYQSGCQVSHLGEESLENNLVACCKEILSNEQLSKESHNNFGVEEQKSGQVILSRWNAVSSDDSSWQNTVSSIDIKESVESLTVETEMKFECESPRSSFHRSIPMRSEKKVSSASDALLSPAELLSEDRYWPTAANQIHSTKPISKIQKNFTRIMRSLSFNEGEQSELKSSSKLQKSKDPTDSENTGFAHYWIPTSAYSLTALDLMNDGDAFSMKMQQTTDQLQGSSLESGMGNNDKGPNCSVASLVLIDKICTTNLNSEQCAGGPSVMANTLLLSKKDSAANLDESCTAQLSSRDLTQVAHDVQLDCPTEMQCKVQGIFTSKKVKEDIGSCKVVESGVSKCGRSEIDAKRCLQQSGENFTVQVSLCTETLQIEPEKIEPENAFAKLVLSEKQIGIASSSSQNDGSVIEGASKCSSPSYPEIWRGKSKTACGKGVNPSSLLSVYKNPLWRDEFEVDFEKRHGSQNQELLDCSYSDEEKFLDSDQNRIGFSKRSLGAVWDTYEGMGGFISSIPNSPSCSAKQVSDVDHILASSEWDLESSSKQLKEIGEMAGKVCGSFAQSRLKCHSQAEQGQQLGSSLVTTASENINHDIMSSDPGTIFCHKRNSTSEKNSSLDSAKLSDGWEECLREHSIRSLLANSHSAKLININSNHRDAVVVSNASTSNDPFLVSGPKCTQWKRMVPITEMICDADEVGGDSGASDQFYCDESRTERESKLQACGASSINIESSSAFQCADKTLQIDPLCAQHNKECSQPAYRKLGSAKTDAPKENHSVKDLGIHSNNGTEAGEEVKQVTFIYSDSKEPPKDLQAGGSLMPEVPFDLLATWIFSFFTHASKDCVNIKRKEQKQPLIQGKAHEDQAELKRIGKKVQALEVEIDRFKQENRKLRSLLKCMIRKMKQLQQGFRRRKRNGSSRGLMTCIYSVHVQRRSKFSRKL